MKLTIEDYSNGIMSRLLLLVCVLFCIKAQVRADDYPADYAGNRIRFHALFLWDPEAESAHVEFDQQALHFFHKLSYGNGFTYDVRTQCPESLDSLKQYDLVVMLNALPHKESQREAFEQYMEQVDYMFSY